MINHNIHIQNNQNCITCNVCDFTSYNTNDITELYCAKCDMFHDYPNKLKLNVINKNKNKWLLQKKEHSKQNHFTKFMKSLKKNLYLLRI